ncbi:MAG: hypothetical protein H6Q72_1592 [Firmicutes bacterium]|nr:hypothetical protein [Bacillota bacterium]
MKKIFSRRTQTIDPTHMLTLHQEAAEQLELMRTAVDASEHASDSICDTLTSIAEDHWEAYLDVLHMICLHDETFATVMKTQVLTKQAANDPLATEQRQSYSNRLLVLSLLPALTQRHRRFCYFYGLRINPMGDYIKESIATEREHIAEMIAMVQNMI